MRMSDSKFLCLACARKEDVDFKECADIEDECKEVQKRWKTIYDEVKGLLTRDRGKDPYLI